MADNEIDRLTVAFEVKFNDALKQFSRMENETDKLASEMDKLEDKSEDVSDEFKKLNRSLDTSEDQLKSTSSSVEELTRDLNEEAKASQRAGRQNEETAEQTEELDKKTKNASNSNKNFIDRLKDLEIAGFKIGGVATVIVGAMVAIGTAASKAATEFDKMESSIMISTGKVGDELEQLSEIASGLFSSNPISTEDVASAVGDLNTLWDVEGEKLEWLSQRYIEFARVSGMSVKDSIDQARPVFKKWGVSVEEQAGAMDMLYQVTAKYGIGMQPLLKLLSDGDRGLQTLNMTLKEAAVAMGMVYKSDGLDTATEFVGVLERGLNKVISTANSQYASALDAAEEAAEQYESALKNYGVAEKSFGLAKSFGNESAMTEASSALEIAREELQRAKTAQILANEAVSHAKSAINTDELEQAFRDIVMQIATASSDTEAIQIAGTLLGEEFARKISGAFSGGMKGYQDGSKLLDGQTISDMYEASMTLEDRITTITNQVNEGLVPAGDNLNGVLDRIIGNIEPLQSAISTLADLTVGWFSLIIGDTEGVATAISNVLEPIRVWLDGVYKWWNEVFASPLSGLLSAITGQDIKLEYGVYEKDGAKDNYKFALDILPINLPKTLFNTFFGSGDEADGDSSYDVYTQKSPARTNVQRSESESYNSAKTPDTRKTTSLSTKPVGTYVPNTPVLLDTRSPLMVESEYFDNLSTLKQIGDNTQLSSGGINKVCDTLESINSTLSSISRPVTDVVVDNDATHLLQPSENEVVRIESEYLADLPNLKSISDNTLATVDSMRALPVMLSAINSTLSSISRPVTNNYTVNQTISSPEPISGARIEQATYRALNSASKSVINY